MEITQNLSVSISTASHFSLYRQPTTTLGTAAPLYNPHSRNRRAAPRFSPTRFIPPVAPAGIFRELGYSHALGIKRYTLDWSSCPAVERDPQRVSGAWVFRGTRIPVSALFENLEDGVEITQFVEWFPGVTIEQVRAVLDHTSKSLALPQVA